MTDELIRGTLEHCLAQGVWATRLLKRFQAVVSEEEMALVRYWFEELHRKADLYLQQGHELVSVGIENREEWHAGPFMVFNPTKWNGARRELVAPTSAFNPRKWVSIQPRSLTTPRYTSLSPARSGRNSRVFATAERAPGLGLGLGDSGSSHSGSSLTPRPPLKVSNALQPVLTAS